MVVRISDKTQNYSKVTKLLVKPSFFMTYPLLINIIVPPLLLNTNTYMNIINVN